jgi:hypothetical protein
MKKAISSLICIALTSCVLMGMLSAHAEARPSRTSESYVAPVIKDNLRQLRIEPKIRSRLFYRVVEVEGFDPEVEIEAAIRSGHRPSFESRGRGSANSRVVDKNERTVFIPVGRNTITSVVPSPDGQRVSVTLTAIADPSAAAYVDGRRVNDTSTAGHGAFVIDPDGTSFKLPAKPPGEHKFPFDGWRWVNNNLLVAMSGDEKLDEDGEPVTHDANVAQWRIYVYNISRNELTELELPSPLNELKTAQIAGISERGYIRLVHEDADSTLPRDLGWFEIRDLRR